MFSDNLENVFNNPKAVQVLNNAARFGATASYEQQPANVRARVRALKNLQLQTLEIEKKYFQEVHALECKYEKLYEPLMKKRAEIVTGRYEPTGKDTEFNEELDESTVNNTVDNSIKGIPEFWLTIFKNVDKIAFTISPADEKVLKHLIDVRLNMIENPMGFELEFEFEPNQYFTNKILKKSYKLSNEIDKEAPFSYEGPEVIDCQGTEIQWKSDDVNPSKAIFQKITKNKLKGIVKKRHVQITEESFFDFFSPPKVPDPKSEEEYDEEVREKLEEDFEIGEVLRQAVLHEAVLCYTGEAIIDEEDDYDVYDEIDEDSDEDNSSFAKSKGF